MPGRVSWRSVEYLNINLHWTKAHNDLEELYRLLYFLPCLRTFHLTESCSKESENFTWNDIDMMHSFLPQLKEICIDVLLSPIRLSDIERIKEIVPSTSITKLTVGDKNISSRWLYYFSTKYENLETFTWKMQLNKNTIDSVPDERTPVIQLPSSPFKKLATVNVENHEHGSISQHILFWKRFDKFRAKPRSIDYKLFWHSDIPQKAENIVNECLSFVSPFIQSFVFKSYNKSQNVLDNPMEFSVCPLLVSLHLQLPSSCVALDMILDNCSSLRNLALCYRWIFIDPKASRIPDRHLLRNMSISNSNVNPDLFNYLSFRCRELETMDLTGVNIFGTVPIETGKLSINMPYTSLKYLELNSVQYYSTHDKDNDSLFNNLGKKAINLILFEQLNVEFSIVYDEKNPGMVDTLLSMPKTEPVWIHYYLSSVPCLPAGRMRVLDKSEIKYVQGYIDDFKENQEIFFSQPYFDDNPYGLEPKIHWKKDFIQGCAVWSCKSISKNTIRAFKDEYTYDFQKSRQVNHKKCQFATISL
ncbi:hypothetical protein CLU79DRAFT_754384 [Phycomyces nitens]|nr:hypothetical protein CLU79DRAFT_754384 [Phycomyces nitens]